MNQTRSYIGKVVLSLACATSCSHAAVTFDAAAGASGAANTTIAWSQTIANNSNRALLVAVTLEDADGAISAAPTGVTFGTQSFTQLFVNTLTGGGFDNQVSMWYLMDPVVGTDTITIAPAVPPSSVDLNTVGNLVRATSASFFDVGSIPTNYALFTTTGSAPSVSFTGIASGSAAFAAVNFSASGTAGTSANLTIPSPGGVFTGGQSGHAAGYATGLSGDVTLNFNQNNARNPMGAVILAPVPEPGTVALALLAVGGFVLRRRR